MIGVPFHPAGATFWLRDVYDLVVNPSHDLLETKLGFFGQVEEYVLIGYRMS